MNDLIVLDVAQQTLISGGCEYPDDSSFAYDLARGLRFTFKLVANPGDGGSNALVDWFASNCPE